MNLPGVQIKPKHRREIYEDVSEQSRPSGSYYVMMALSTVIAAYGLLINSAAVVVGAMLVAPLMGPIFGIALALVSGNRRLLWQAVQSEVFGILIALSVGVLIGLAPLRMPLGSEDWLVRTQPTLHDLAIALASGLAGAYAMIDERVSPSLPGVAISVAVLPPLATCGLATAAMNWEMALGAMQLFIANFFAIQVAAAVVFSLFGMLRVKRDPRARREEEEERKLMHFFARFSVSIAILLVMAAFMTQTLLRLATDRRLSSTIEHTLDASVGTVSGARLSDTDFSRQDGRLRVTARVMTPRLFDTDEIAAMEEQLEDEVEQDVNLVLRLLISRDMDREGTVYATPEDEQLAQEQRERRRFLQRASTIVSEHLESLPGAELSDVHRSAPDGLTTVTAVVRAPDPIGPETVAAIEEALQSEFDRSLRFTVRTVLTRAATSDDFLYEEEARRALSEREALISAVQTVVDSWLSENLEGAVVEEVRVESLDPRAIVVTMLTPRSLAEDEPAQIRGALSDVIGPEFDLTVRYALGGLAMPAESQHDEDERPSEVPED
ncbi:MAG: TIGR00341 family protein [Armatimonadota bacterium]